MDITSGCLVWDSCASCPLESRCEDTLKGPISRWKDIARVCVLLKEGRRHEDIEELLGKSPRTVGRYLKWIGQNVGKEE